MNKDSLKTEIVIHGKIPSDFTERKIKKMIEKTLTLAKSTATSIGIVFVGPKKMQSLNKEYRKKDKPTDVLSFAYHKSKKPNKGIEGDIIICPSYVKTDIKNSEIRFSDQINRLLIHGVLHLSGLDHAKDAEAKSMFAKQEKIFKAL